MKTDEMGISLMEGMERMAETTYQQTTPDAIRRIREELKMQQTKFGEELGVRQATVSDWETGAVQPSRLAINAILHLRDRFDSSRILYRARKAEKDRDMWKARYENCEESIQQGTHVHMVAHREAIKRAGEHADKAIDQMIYCRHQAGALKLALKGILSLGRKDTSNPKYDDYYKTAIAALGGES